MSRGDTAYTLSKLPLNTDQLRGTEEEEVKIHGVQSVLLKQVFSPPSKTFTPTRSQVIPVFPLHRLKLVSAFSSNLND